MKTQMTKAGYFVNMLNANCWIHEEIYMYNLMWSRRKAAQPYRMMSITVTDEISLNQNNGVTIDLYWY